MKKRLFALALVGCMAFSMTAFAEESTEGTSEGSVDLSAVETVTDGKLTVATSPDFAPYEFYAIDEDGTPSLAGFDMALAQYIAGMGFSNVGLGIVHSMAHPLGAFYDTPHGVANALLLPYVMEYNAESPAKPKYKAIAKAMGVQGTENMTDEEGVKAAVEAVRKLSLSINIPQKLHEINVKEEDLKDLSVAAFNDVCTGGNPRETNPDEILEIYKKAF